MARGLQFVGRQVWAEISLRAILHNLKVIRQTVGRDKKILAIVKANAYGLGAVAISKALAKAGVEWLGVTCTDEGAELRAAGIRKRILVLTGFWPGEEKELLRENLTPTVTNVGQLHLLEKATKRLAGRKKNSRTPFHLKINTGMNRQGFEFGELDEFAREFKKCPHLTIEGAYTHFASAEDFTSQQTSTQEMRFLAAMEKLKSLRVAPQIIHLANSGAICARPGTWGQLVRPGAVLYGYHQGFEPASKKEEVMKRMELQPCLTLRTKIIALRDLAVGDAVGYGARFVAQRPTRIAVLPAGYADGIVRALTNKGQALLRGKRVPLVGVISMDLATIDTTDVPEAKIGDVVTIFGQDGGDEILVSDAARSIGTVTSDLMCALGHRVRKFYLT
jgi:alanine racemase